MIRTPARMEENVEARKVNEQGRLRFEGVSRRGRSWEKEEEWRRRKEEDARRTQREGTARIWDIGRAAGRERRELDRKASFSK